MKKTNKKILRISGLLLLFLALLLVVHNIIQDKNAEKTSKQVLAKFEESKEQLQIATRTKSENTNTITNTLILPDEEEEILIVDVDGAPIVGVLEIPNIDLKLPVTVDWHEDLMWGYANLYHGENYSDSLVIMAHGNKSHFAGLNYLVEGDQVIFTDVLDRQKVYDFAGKEIIHENNVEEMIETNYPLTLFTCTLDGRSRVTVRLTEAELN
ncbi:MAG: sortase [Clostridiaceae bacterium]|nr:sortase [Clostridiaceae bacterium]